MNFTRGDTFKFKFQRLSANGEVITTIAEKMWFTVKENHNTNDKILQKTLVDGGITFTTDGYYHVTIDPKDTKNLFYRSYVYDIQVENNGVVQTISKGNVTIAEEVTFEGGE